MTIFFSLLFSLLLYTRTFFALSFAKKMHSFFPPVINSRILFPLSLLVTIFPPFLNKCQLFISKDFETSLLTLLGVSLVLWRRKADNEHSNPLFYCPSPLNSQHLHFQFTVASFLKFFVRSRRDWEKKCREGSRQSAFQIYGNARLKGQ